MEPTPLTRTVETYNEVIAGLDAFYSDKTKLDVWVKIFWVLAIYIGKDGPLSEQAQKLVNFSLQNKPSASYLTLLVPQHKELICKVHDLAIPPAQNLDDALSSGVLTETISKRLEKETVIDASIFNLINLCVSATAIHFCEVLQKFKESKGQKLSLSNRKIPKIFKRKSLLFTSSNAFLKQIFAEPVVLLDGFLDSLKPVIGNYLNIQNLFQVTSPYFKNKKGLLSGFISSSLSNKPEFTGKIVNLNTIFDSTYAGREMIESKLSQINLNQSENPQEVKAAKWSLLCCVNEFQPQLLSIVEKLPLFLRPKSNGDILSFCQTEIAPTFKYQVLKPGYVEKPMLSQYVQVFLNAGKACFEVLAFHNSEKIPNSLLENEHENILNAIDSYNVQYSRVKVGPKGIAVVPSNCFYVLLTHQKQRVPEALIEIVHWNVLPKFETVLSQTILALCTKRKLVKDYIFLPIEHMLLSYLNHQLLQVVEFETLDFTKKYLLDQLNKQQTQLCNILSKNSHIPVHSYTSQTTPSHQQLFCFSCKQNFINYFGKTNMKQKVCMACCSKLTDKLEQIQVLYESNDLRYPLTLVTIFLTKRKYPGQNIVNKFEKTICKGKFIGSIDNENCKAESQQIGQKLNPKALQQKLQQFYLANRLKELKITSLEETIISIALHHPQSEAEKAELMEKVKCYMKQIQDPDSILRQICGKYQKTNLVTDVMWAFKISNSTGIF